MSFALHPSAVVFLLENLDAEKDAPILQKLYEIVLSQSQQAVACVTSQTVQEMNYGENTYFMENYSIIQPSFENTNEINADSSPTMVLPLNTQYHHAPIEPLAIYNTIDCRSTNNFSQDEQQHYLSNDEPSKQKSKPRRGRRQEAREEMVQQMTRMMQHPSFVARRAIQKYTKSKPYDRYVSTFKDFCKDSSSDE